MMRRTFPLVRQLSTSVKNGQVSKKAWDVVRPPSDISRMMREIDRKFEAFEREFFKIPPFRYLAPRLIPIEGVNGVEPKFRVDVDVSGFQPEDIKVSLVNGKILLEAKMEYNGEDGRIVQHLVREFTVPDNLDEKSIESYLNNNGILTIEGRAKSEDVKKIDINRGEKTIPDGSSGETKGK